MKTNHYSIHDIVTFKVVDEYDLWSGLLSDINKKYGAFKSSEVPNPDLILNLGNFSQSDLNCLTLDDRYNVRYNYLYCKGVSYKRAKWRFEISGFEDGLINAKVSNNFFGSMFVSGNFIDPILHFVLNKKGYSVIHASCVSKDGNAILFAARSGGGKTTIALNLIEHGYDFMGDNFSILKDGYALSYLSPLNIFTYNLSPIVRRKLNFNARFNLGLKSLLFKMTSGYAKIFSKIDVTEVTDQIVDRAKIKKIILILPKNNNFQVECLDKKTIINHLLINHKFETHFFEKHFLEYNFAFSDSKFATHWQQYVKNLENNLPDDISYVKIEVPEKYDKKTFDKILDLID